MSACRAPRLPPLFELALFHFGACVGLSDQLPPAGPAEHQDISRIANTSSHAETISCCATEYAVALLALVTLSTTKTLSAWVTPTLPAVKDRSLEAGFAPVTATTVWKLTGVGAG